ncbi:MAG TPA: tRNA (adenosine(37)-N6)-threonylcarbamoyltransferase complex dimerization subunit type 1 TsaB [Verrucomicrobiae bacterium]|nr:tRNA (adenosine(37)-N6)-threonylcarbamoyltransferase complex dimerization subunit type 1 TsaB [Verrucomicrobiae bacterium]
MNILAIDFSSNQRSVAASRAGTPFEVINSDPRTTRALEMIEEALQGAGLDRQHVDCVVAGLGPGSYTGIRASLALAQGWQLANGVRLLGISSAEAIAAKAHANGLRGTAAVVIDAQRGELYLAVYSMSESGAAELSPLRIASVIEAQELAQSGCMLIGPEVTRWFQQGQVVFASASQLALLALQRNEAAPGERLEPIYLRETTFVKAPRPRVIP